MFNALRILLGWSGRIGRRTWLAGLAFLVFFYPTLVAVSLAAASRPRAGLNVTLGAALLLLWMIVALDAKRLRDMGRSPLWALAPAAPLALKLFPLPPYAVIALRRGDMETVIAMFGAYDPFWGVAFMIQSTLAVWLLLAGPSPRAPGERLAFTRLPRAPGPVAPWPDPTPPSSASPWGAKAAPPSPQPPARDPPPPSPMPGARGSGLPRRDGPVIDRRR